jgi:hypothetical protein
MRIAWRLVVALPHSFGAVFRVPDASAVPVSEGFHRVFV